ncbi:MAG: type II secretion system protein GspC [Thioalkalispiraceae bacterium]|jgi:general secretion pathway protein C
MQGQLHKAAQEWATLFTNFPVKKLWRAAPKWISVILVILVAKSASEMTWLIFAPAQDSSSNYKRGGTPAVTPDQIAHQPRLRTVANLHLFGVASVKPVTQEAPIDAPKTGLKLTLRGVFAASTPEQAMALIADARGEEKVYKKSDTIFSGVTLYEIYPDKVILERSGSFETLNLPRDESSLQSRAISRPRTSIRTTRPTIQPSSSAIVRTRTIRAGKRLENLKAQLTENPAEFMQNVRIEPVYDNSQQMKGIRFTHKDRQVMRALGLRPGDVIVEINGQPVTPSAMTELLGQLSSLNQLNLGIERNGHRENLNISM